MTRQLSRLDNMDDGDENSFIRNGMTKSQVKRTQAQSNKKPSKSEMSSQLRPKKEKTRKAK